MRIDLHVHTTAYSSCSVLSPEELMFAAKGADLDGVCITEHNRIWTRDDAKALSDKHGIAVFRGTEITTTGGDILVFGCEYIPDRMLAPAELKKHVDDAGGAAIAAHPFRGFHLFGFRSLGMPTEEAAKNPTFLNVHGLEVCNGMCTGEENRFSREVADVLGLVKLGGSDAHNANQVGRCVTVFLDRIDDEVQLARAILSGRHTVVQELG
jgi:predicted metal-dependent phosphoesterase TrpH